MQPELLSVNAFCEAHSISRATFYRLIEHGRGPRTVRLGQRYMITREAAEEWRKQLADQHADKSVVAG